MECKWSYCFLLVFMTLSSVYGQAFHNVYSYSCTSIILNADIMNTSSVAVLSTRYSTTVCSNSGFGINIGPAYRGRLNCSVDADTDSVTFCFYNITVADSGVYNSTLGNSYGSSTVYVMDRPTTPTISPTSALVGRAVTLTCSSNSTSTPSPTGQTISYIWTVDNASPSDTLYQVTGNKLTIKTAHIDDKNRVFQCVATENNGLSSYRKSQSIDVMYTPVVSISPNTVSRKEGDTNLRLTCAVEDANPTIILGYTWYKNNTPNTILSRQQTYTIAALSRSHAGVYHCRAENSVGLSTSPASVSLDVQYPASVKSFTLNSSDFYEHKPLYMHCAVDSNPRSRIMFLNLNTQEILQTNVDVLNSSYIIPKTDCRDTGKYACSVYNGIGGSSNSTKDLNIFCLPKLVNLQSVPNELSAEVGKDIELSLSFVSNPMPTVKWFFKGSAYTEKQEVLFAEKDMESSGVLYKAKLKKHLTGNSDFGLYIVSLLNSYGSSNYSFNVKEQKISDVGSGRGNDGLSVSSIVTLVIGVILCVIGGIFFTLTFILRKRNQSLSHEKSHEESAANNMQMYEDLNTANVNRTDNTYDELQDARIKTDADTVHSMG